MQIAIILKKRNQDKFQKDFDFRKIAFRKSTLLEVPVT